MVVDDEPQGDRERSAAVDAWVTAFDREIAQNGDFAASVAAISAHGCFDVRAVAERWLLANRDGDVGDAPPSVEAETPPVASVPVEVPPLEEAPDRQEPAAQADGSALKPVIASSADIAHFHSLLHGGIDRAQIYEAFPGFRMVIDEAIVQYEAAAPILSKAATGPSRADLDDEIRRTRQDLVDSGQRPRRRWRSRD
jgi:hypothetical protein